MTRAAPAPPEDRAFAARLCGTDCGVREGLAEVMQRLSPFGLSDEDRSRIELVLAEVLNNIVEHALADDPVERGIAVYGVIEDRSLHLTVTDHGAAMPGLRVPQAAVPDVSVGIADLPEGGFGWLMIHSLAQQVAYHRQGDENRLTLTLGLKT